MTEDLFREDAELFACGATVVATDDAGIVLDRTVFYALGGGQAGDTGVLRLPGGAELRVIDTRKHKARDGEILHLTEPGGAVRTCDSTPPPTCCVRCCRIRSTAARSRQRMRGWISTWPSRWTRTA